MKKTPKKLTDSERREHENKIAQLDIEIENCESRLSKQSNAAWRDRIELRILKFKNDRDALRRRLKTGHWSI